MDYRNSLAFDEREEVLSKRTELRVPFFMQHKCNHRRMYRKKIKNTSAAGRETDGCIAKKSRIHPWSAEKQTNEPQENQKYIRRVQKNGRMHR